MTGYHEPFSTHLLAQFGMLARHRTTAEMLLLIEFSKGYTHHPGVQFHAALVAFLHSESQWVVGGCHARLSSDALVPWLVLRRVNDAASDAGLHQYSVDVGFLEFVEDVSQFTLLHLYLC